MSPHDYTAKQAAIAVIAHLRHKGATALLAGGCVRDELLGLTPKDYDIATDALPEQVRAWFPRAREVGAQFGVVLLRKYGHDIEVATFRTDGSYKDGRHPESVHFTNAREDAQRRDFTINGLFYDTEKNEVIDYVGGQEDLRNGLLRTIGDPAKRFAEDHLRMLRAVRFAARLGFQIHEETVSHINKLAPKLCNISAERVAMELEAILTVPSRRRGWRWLVDTGLHGFLAPSWRDDTVGNKIVLSRLSYLPDHKISESLAYASVWCHLPVDNVKQICRELRLSNRLTGDILWLINSLSKAAISKQLELADLKQLLAHPSWPDLVLLLQADQQAQDKSLQAYHELIENTRDIDRQTIAPIPLLNGDDLKVHGIKNGPQMGKLLAELYRAQLNEQIVYRRDALAWLDRLRFGKDDQSNRGSK